MTSRAALLLLLAALPGCFPDFSDAATRIAADLQHGADRLKREGNATYSVRHHEPSKAGECEGPYKVQLDKVGALIVWCYDAAGTTVSSHSTTSHAPYVDTPQTYIVDKPAGSDLVVELERRGGRAVVTNVR